MNKLFMANGVALPQPKRGYTVQIQTLVEGMRNTNGVDISQPIITLMKYEGLEWPYLTAAQWESLTANKRNHRINLTHYSIFTRSVVTEKFYWGDADSEPFKWANIGSVAYPTSYINCKINLIQCGG